MGVKILGIIGYPLENSLSPAMHNASLEKQRLPYLYLPFPIRAAKLKKVFYLLRRGKIVGLNVTIPYKEKVLSLLDAIDPFAKSIGAVNTIIRRKGRLIGYNTDANGYLLSLKKETGWNCRKKRVLILGAGGAARAVVYALAREGARSIVVANRTIRRGKKLIRDFRKQFPDCRFQSIPFTSGQLAKKFPEIDLFVNAIPTARRGDKKLPLFHLPKKAVVSDLATSPPTTPLLKSAKRVGLRTHSGLGMLLYQGALSYQLWTGRKPNLIAMKKGLQEVL